MYHKVWAVPLLLVSLVFEISVIYTYCFHWCAFLDVSTILTCNSKINHNKNDKFFFLFFVGFFFFLSKICIILWWGNLYKSYELIFSIQDLFCSILQPSLRSIYFTIEYNMYSQALLYISLYSRCVTRYCVLNFILWGSNLLVTIIFTKCQALNLRFCFDIALLKDSEK